jgi:uncharacterized YccA/Bax inhibitor family protein
MSNPILNDDRFSSQEGILNEEPMTIQGTINKIFLLFACLAAGVAVSLYYLFNGQGDIVPIFMSAGAIIGFILVLVTCFNVKLSKYTAAPYALMEGLFLGGVSALFESAYNGIVLQAIFATLATLFVMLFLYKTRAIRYTENFSAVITTAVLSIGVIYLAQVILSFFHRSIPGIFDNGIVGIVFSLVVIAFAALSLIQDFFFIESSAQKMLPKDYEWFGAMGLMITLVWLYMEILRLLAKLNSRR